jgi:hypothetical protein
MLAVRGFRAGPWWGGKRVGIRMRAVTARWVAYVISAGSIALIIGALVLTYLNRHALVPAGQNTWGFPYAFGEAVDIAVPAVGLVLASRRPVNLIGWLFLTAGAALGLGSFFNAYGLHALIRRGHRGDPGDPPATADRRRGGAGEHP